jgi:predicted permease
MVSDVAYRIRAVLFRGRMESELAEELEFHFQQQVEQLIAQGCPPAEARRRARLLFGGLDEVKEECRDARGISVIEALWQNLHSAARRMGRSPGFSAVAVVSLAIAFAGGAVVSSLLARELHRLAVAAPDQLVSFRSAGAHLGPCWGAGGPDSACFSWPMYLDFAERSAVFSGVIARTTVPADLTWRDEIDRVSVELVSTNYFAVLGVSAAAGRLFDAQSANQTVLSYSYWSRRFQKDPRIVGQSIVLNQVPVRIVGVSSYGLHSLMPGVSADVLVPMEVAPSLAPASPELLAREWAWMNIVGRLKPGMTRQGAEAELAPRYRRIIEEEARTVSPSWTQRSQFLAKRLELIPAGRGIERNIDQQMAILIAIVACVLITAYANLAGLCLARVAARQRELAIRAALGAGRSRIAGQIFAEFLLPVALGGVPGSLAGLLLAGGVPGFLFDPERARSLAGPGIGILLLAFAIMAAAAVGFGAIPALASVRGKNINILATGNIVPGGLRRGRFWRVLVTAQVTVAAMFMYGAFTFSSYWLKKTTVDRGPGHLVSFTIDTSSKGYSGAQSGSLFQRLEERLSSMPGIRGAGFAVASMSEFQIEGRAAARPEANRFLWMAVTPGYFNAAGFSFVEGESFDAAGRSQALPHVCINEAFRRRIFGNRNASGKRIRAAGDSTWSVVSGVVRDFESNEGKPLVYYPYYGGAAAVAFVVRGDAAPEPLCRAVRALAGREAPGLRIDGPKTIDSLVAESNRGNAVMAGILVVFGLLTMALAAIGVYGVTAYLVARRTSEIGVRMALGASVRAVVAMVMKEVVWMGITGAVGGSALVVVASRVLVPLDGPDFHYEYPLLLSGAAVAALAAMAAGFLASRRAARIEPTLALRSE